MKKALVGIAFFLTSSFAAATVDYEVISDRGKESAGNLRVRK
jgi:hypothetical protein